MVPQERPDTTTSNAFISGGLDLRRGRPTPAIGSTAAKLQQRKLDALKRGIHRIADVNALPYGINFIGLGSAGAKLVHQILDEAPDDLLAVEGSRLAALTIDIGSDQPPIEPFAAKFTPGRGQFETLSLSCPTPASLLETLGRYRDFMRLESSLVAWNEAFRPWIEPQDVPAATGETIPRAVAKAIYGQAYYDGDRPAAAALKRFAAQLEATQGDAVICILFGLGGGTGSAIAVDLARHLSNAILGRRVLVTGIGILPCDGDDQAVQTRLFCVLNELDSMADEAKNRGIVMSCGDLYRNPFTAGFIAVPQQPVWRATGDRTATHRRIGQELTSLLTRRQGANLWELLRLLNWVAAPSTQHSAARTPWGARWLHMLGFLDAPASLAVSPDLPAQLGLTAGYRPEFIEVRVPADTEAAGIASDLDNIFNPDVPPQLQPGAAEGSVQFVLPRLAKTDLTAFTTARQGYDAATAATRYQDHALLLERGIQLCEPSTMLGGMAGASLWGGRSWIAVPLADVRGEPDPSSQPQQVEHAA